MKLVSPKTPIFYFIFFLSGFYIRLLNAYKPAYSKQDDIFFLPISFACNNVTHEALLLYVNKYVGNENRSSWSLFCKIPHKITIPVVFAPILILPEIFCPNHLNLCPTLKAWIDSEIYFVGDKDCENTRQLPKHLSSVNRNKHHAQGQ